MTTHTGPAPLETPEDMVRRMFAPPRWTESQTGTALVAIRARDAQWAERLTAERQAWERKAERSGGEAASFYSGAAAALRDAAKMVKGETR